VLLYLWDKLGYVACSAWRTRIICLLGDKKIEEKECLKAQGKRSKITGLKWNIMGHLKPTSDDKSILPSILSAKPH